MKFKDIVAKKTYEKNGEQKPLWRKVGVLKETDDGKQFIEIFAIGDFYVFDQKKKDDYSQSAPKNDYSQPESNGGVDTMEIPF